MSSEFREFDFEDEFVTVPKKLNYLSTQSEPGITIKRIFKRSR